MSHQNQQLKVNLSLAAAIEAELQRRREQPDPRQGLHVSDVVSGLGLNCLRYVQLALMHADENPVPTNPLTQRRLLMGQAFHNVIYPLITPALETRIQQSGASIKTQVDIEKPVISELGLHGTPDIVIRFIEDEEVIETWVVDIKTKEPQAFLKASRPDGQRHIPAEVARQIQIYASLVGADLAVVLWLESGPPYEMEQSSIIPQHTALQNTHLRMSVAKKHIEGGSFAPPNFCKSCKWCKFNVTCSVIQQGEPHV
jgi:hypothetical protein